MALDTLPRLLLKLARPGPGAPGVEVKLQGPLWDPQILTLAWLWALGRLWVAVFTLHHEG